MLPSAAWWAGCMRRATPLRRVTPPHAASLALCRAAPSDPSLPLPLPLRCLQDIPDPVLPAEVTHAFDVAYNNIRAFHTAQQSAPMEVETMPGVKCRCGRGRRERAKGKVAGESLWRKGGSVWG